MTKIDNILVEDTVFTAKFSCDYGKCKGACCNKPVPGVELFGGALSDYDAAEILYHRRAISLLCDKSNQVIAGERPVSKYEGGFYTTLHDSKCVLCSMDKGTCVLKLAKTSGVSDIGIPLSCQLYPLLWEIDGDVETLNVGDIFDDCKYGYEKGEREGTYLIDFLKEPIIRGLGEDFYRKLKEEQSKRI